MAPHRHPGAGRGQAQGLAGLDDLDSGLGRNDEQYHYFDGVLVQEFIIIASLARFFWYDRSSFWSYRTWSGALCNDL